MSCKYCEDSGLVKELPCPEPECIVGKAFRKQITKYQGASQEPSSAMVLSEKDETAAIEAIQEIKDLATDMKDNKKAFDLLRYRFKDNGLMLFIYGPKENEDKVIERLEQVIRKYKNKKHSIGKFQGSLTKSHPKEFEFSFKRLLGK